MANKDSGKGVSLAKRARISKAEQNMFIAVCLASVLLGITIIGAYHLIMTIQFNGKILSETAAIRDGIKQNQDNIMSLSNNVKALAANENLESVGRENSECEGYTSLNTEIQDASVEDISKARTCSALRVVGDALPSLTSVNDFEGTLNSFIKLLIHDNNAVNIEALNVDDTMEYVVKVGDDGSAETQNDGDGQSSGTEGEKLNINAMGISMNVKDTATKVKKMMSSIEDSIRNYDIRNVTISWSEQESEYGGRQESIIDLNATYSAYYSSSVSAFSKNKVICADDSSEKCITNNKTSEGK